MSPCPIPATITITPRAPPNKQALYVPLTTTQVQSGPGLIYIELSVVGGCDTRSIFIEVLQALIT